MIFWIESQSIPVITVAVFALCYGLAAIVFTLAMFVSRRRIAADLQALTPVMLTPLAVIAGLLIAFLASRVWANVDRAYSFIGQEASAIGESVLLAGGLPAPTREAVDEGVIRYMEWVEAEDWPAMVRGRATLRSLPPGLLDAMRALLSFVPSGGGQTVVQQATLTAIDRALEARRNRILLSRAIIAPHQWAVIFLLDALILLTVAMVHLGRPLTIAVAQFLFSTAVAACLVLLMANDRPFAEGGVTLEPVAIHELGHH